MDSNDSLGLLEFSSKMVRLLFALHNLKNPPVETIWPALTRLTHKFHSILTIPMSQDNRYVTDEIRFRFSVAFVENLVFLVDRVLSPSNPTFTELHNVQGSLTRTVMPDQSILDDYSTNIVKAREYLTEFQLAKHLESEVAAPLRFKLVEQCERAMSICIYEFLDIYRRCESPLESAFLMALIGNNWELLMEALAENPKLKCQFEIGQYRVDLAYIDDDTKIVIELDGHTYHEKTPEQATHDRSRDRYLTGEGWKVIRFHSKEIKENLQQCAVETLKLMGGRYIGFLEDI